MPHTEWDDITHEDLRIAAKVARASGGVVMAGAAAAWDKRADLMLANDYPWLPLWDS